jgi:raffinose/stachyose/melibiose transport system permease protein
MIKKYVGKYFPVFLLPTVFAFILAFVAPFVIGMYLSFCEFTTVTDANFTGIENYLRVFEGSGFTDALWFTVKFTVVAVLSVNIFAFLLALVLTRPMRGTSAFRTGFFMPNLIGGIVLGYIWQIIINGVLGYMGVDITYAAKYGFWGLVILTNWQQIGYMMIIYIAGIQNVPDDLIEAADIDGATYWQKLRHIILPMVKPAVTICTFLTLTNSFKLFDQNLALTGGAPANETTMLALDIYKTFYNRVGYEGIGQAKAVVFFVIVAIIALVQQYLTRAKEE